MWDKGGLVASPWMSADKMFTTPEFLKPYDSVEISLMTPKVALVPSRFFDPESAREALSATVQLDGNDKVEHIEVESFGAELAYSLTIGEVLSGAIAQALARQCGFVPGVLPEMYYILRDLAGLDEHNRIVASYADSRLHLGLAQGDSLLLANVFDAPDFTTAQYYIFLALKKLQLNPEASTIHFRTPLSEAEEMSLYRYFKSVERQ